LAPALLAAFGVRHHSRLHPEEELCDAIAGYLARHPDAADTLQGIAEWWLPMQRIEAEVEQVTRAVELLVARGLLQGVGTGPSRRYRLPREYDVHAPASLDTQAGGA
jgi:hypothetical protein